MGIWKTVGALWVGDKLSDGKLLDRRKGGIGYFWFYLFIIVFFPFWLIYKIMNYIFATKK